MGLLIIALAAAGLVSGADPRPGQTPSWMQGGTDVPSLDPKAKSGWSGASDLPKLGSSVPWIERVEALGAKKADVKAEKLPLQDFTWARLRADLALVARARQSLLRALSYAKEKPDVFPPKDTGAPYFEEYRAEAVEAWVVVLDHFLALDGVIERYNDFEGWPDEPRRQGTFLAAFAAFAAQHRFASEWIAATVKIPGVRAAFNEAQPRLGLAGGVLGSLAAGPGAAARRAVLEEGRAYLGDGAAAVRSLGAVGATTLAGVRQDTGGVRSVRRPKGKVTVPVFEAWQKLESTAADWTGPPPPPKPVAAESPVFAGMPLFVMPVFQPGMYQSALSTGAAEPEGPVQAPWELWLWPQPSTGTRPQTLIGPAQAESLAEGLLPGDILLVRRERFVSETGGGGFWSHVALYIGTPEERGRFFKSDGIEMKLNETARDAYWQSMSAQNGRPRRVLESTAAGGASSSSLAAAASADYLAVLRPRLDKDAKAKAIVRAFALVGKPYDAELDAEDAAAVSAAELVLRAYAADSSRPDAPRLRWAPTRALGRTLVSANGLAQGFDEDFGKAGQVLDLVRFLDANETLHRADDSTLEEFRRTWRRPRWTQRLVGGPEPETVVPTEAPAPAGANKGTNPQEQP